MLKKILILLIVMTSILLTPTIASATIAKPDILCKPCEPCEPCEPYGPTFRGSLIVKSPPFFPGKEINIYGKNFKPGTKVDVYWDGNKIGQTTADSRGNASFPFTIPPDTKTGFHTVGMQGEHKRRGMLVLQRSILVRAEKISRHRDIIPVPIFNRIFPISKEFSQSPVQQSHNNSSLLLISLVGGATLTLAGFGIKILKK